MAISVAPLFTKWYLPIHIWRNNYLTSKEHTLSLFWILHFSIRYPSKVNKAIAQQYLPSTARSKKQFFQSTLVSPHTLQQFSIIKLRNSQRLDSAPIRTSQKTRFSTQQNSQRLDSKPNALVAIVLSPSHRKTKSQWLFTVLFSQTYRIWYLYIPYTHSDPLRLCHTP